MQWLGKCQPLLAGLINVGHHDHIRICTVASPKFIQLITHTVTHNPAKILYCARYLRNCFKMKPFVDGITITVCVSFCTCSHICMWQHFSYSIVFLYIDIFSKKNMFKLLKSVLPMQYYRQATKLKWNEKWFLSFSLIEKFTLSLQFSSL